MFLKLRAMSSNQIDDIKNSISRYLSMREHSRSELFNKLLKKNFDKEDILFCIEEFSEKDLQSDLRYTESFTRSKYNAHKGPNFITASLKANGIDSSVIDVVLANYSSEDWDTIAKNALQKKSAYKTLEPSICKRKQKLFLSNRGFSYKTIENAIRDYWKL